MKKLFTNMVLVKISGLLVLLFTISLTTAMPTDIEKEAKEYLEKVLPEIEERLSATFHVVFAQPQDENWNEETAKRDYIKFTELAETTQDFLKEVQTKLLTYPFDTFEDQDLTRQIKIMLTYDYSVLPDGDKEVMQELTKKFEEIRKFVQFCAFKHPAIEDEEDDCTLTYDKFKWTDELFFTEVLKKVRYYWIEWRKKAGAPFRHDFENFVNLYREAAKLNGFKKSSDMWYHKYEDDKFIEELKEVLKELKPFYEQLHAYLRHWIVAQYDEEPPLEPNAPIPDDLLEKYVIEGYRPFSTQFLPFPYPEKGEYFKDFDDFWHQNTVQPDQYTKKAEEFFESIGFDALPDDFYTHHRRLKLNQTECSPYVFSLLIENQVGYEYCNDVSIRNFLDEHRKMAQVYYYRTVQHQPLPYKDIFWPGFTEAVGYSALASAGSLKHFEKLQLLPEMEIDDEVHLNKLFHVAIQTIFKMPINYIEDKFRTSALDGEISSEDYNCAFWTMMETIAGIQPPVDRTEEDFDPLAKILNGVDEMRMKKVFEKILGFQFHDGLCKKAGHEDRLDTCDYSGSIEAGNALKEMMSLGSSKHWKEVMKIVTDTDKLDATPMIKYFEPLYNWIKAYNEEHNVVVGWEPTNKCTKA